MIRITPVRLIGPEDEQLGVVETSEALRQADAAQLDLVEISPDARPPVCKIMDYGKFKFEQGREEKAKGRNKPAEMKEVRLGRSIKIDPHDVQIRVDQSRRFLMEGHKVQIVQVFRGREMMHRDLGVKLLRMVVDQLADISKVEVPPRTLGKRTNLILAPDKVKIEAIKRKAAKEAAAQARENGAKPAAASEPESKTAAATPAEESHSPAGHSAE